MYPYILSIGGFTNIYILRNGTLSFYSDANA